MSLPSPVRDRWQPLRCGLVELYHYDVEEFPFRDGHLLLRGNNGTGKSKVLSLTLPFLLDASLSASRVEPDGDRHKRMEWNLLMGRYERRIGYTWIELGRREAGGAEQVLTLGCGLRAVAGRPGVEPWFFITEQRIGRDLWLATPDRTALSKDKLIEAIGTRGQVFKTAEAYRRAVDERLFRLGADRYAALIDTLIQLRQPQLSKQPNEQRLSDALTEALAPIERAALESVADAMGQLEDLRRDLEELEAMRQAVAAFGNRYRRYAQVATRRKARVLRQAQTEFDNASRELNAADAALESAREKVAHWRGEEQRLGAQLVAGREQLKVLEADPVMRDARRLAEARERAALLRTQAQEADARATAAAGRLAAESERAARRRSDAGATRDALAGASVRAESHAGGAGLAAEHARLVAAADAALDGGDRGAEVAPTPGAAGAADRLAREAAPDALRRRALESAQRRREQIAAVRSRLDGVASAEGQRATARSARDDRADALDAAAASLEERTAALHAEQDEALAAWRRHTAALRTLELEDADAALAALEGWLETLAGANPLRAALEAARDRLDRELAVREAALRQQQDSLAAERVELSRERTELEQGVDAPPPAPHTRAEGVRLDRAGAPLWKLVDFAPALGTAERAGLEAALEASGLLDAWLLPDGTMLDPRTHDVVLVPRAAKPASLADWLVPALPADADPALQAATVLAVLRSIACAEHDRESAEAWVAPSGDFRIGTLRGAWSKPEAAYVGHAAREAARRSRLAAIEQRLAEIAHALGEHAAALEACEATRRDAREELTGAPADEPLIKAEAAMVAAEQQRRSAQGLLADAEARLVAAEQALEAAREQLARDARDLDLPSEREGLDRVAGSLDAYRTAAIELASAVRDHRRALDELDEQLAREADAREQREAAAAELEAKRLALGEGEATVQALEGSIGKPVAELLERIEATKQALAHDDAAEKRARAQLNVASSDRGIAEKERETKAERLTDRTAERKAAVEALQSFTLESGLLAVALGEAFELPGTPWGIDSALGVARRAEQALGQVAAEDADWARLQNEIGRDWSELQSAMSARGSSATIEPSDHGLIVRIVHQQQPERPDVLQRKIDAELAERRMLLSSRERAVLEQHLEKEIAANLQRMIQETERRVIAINRELEDRPTSTGVRYKLVWEPVPENSADGVPGLKEARRRLLRTSADAWSAEDRRQVGEFLHARIRAETASDDQSTLFDSLARALDYRRWHRFRVQRLQDGQWRPLTGPASSGERALGLTVPLFAACSSHYESADPHAPRLVLLDEAFAGIDDEARASCMALIRQFDLDFVMTSEREWGCYAELPGLSICQLVRREGIDAVHVSRWTWDGAVRRAAEAQAPRFPAEEEWQAAVRSAGMVDLESDAAPRGLADTAAARDGTDAGVE